MNFVWTRPLKPTEIFYFDQIDKGMEIFSTKNCLVTFGFECTLFLHNNTFQSLNINESDQLYHIDAGNKMQHKIIRENTFLRSSFGEVGISGLCLLQLILVYALKFE